MITILIDRSRFCRSAIIAAILSIATLRAAVPLWGQSDSAAKADNSRATFDVASIKQSRGSEADMRLRTTPGRFTATSVSLRFLILMAYGIEDFQLAAAPSWIESARYDVDATAMNDPDLRHLQPMLQALIAERFHAVIRQGTKEVPAYQMEVSKNGLKLPRTQVSDCEKAPPTPPATPAAPVPCGGFSYHPGYLAGKRISLGLLAYTMSSILSQPVVDKTSVAGEFNIELKWAPLPGPYQDGGPAAPSVQGDGGGPGIFSAIEEQLGIKLVSGKGPVPVITVEHIERLLDN